MINSYYATEYGITTADDSAWDQAYKKSAKINADKWFTFRHKLAWPGKPSMDLGKLPCVDYTEIGSNGRSFPVLIFQLSSIKPIEEKVQKMSATLTKKSFTSPTMVRGVNMAGDPNAQMAYLMEQMINSGFSPSKMSSDMKTKAKAFGFDPDAMKIDDEDARKRAKTGGS